MNDYPNDVKWFKWMCILFVLAILWAVWLMWDALAQDTVPINWDVSESLNWDVSDSPLRSGDSYPTDITWTVNEDWHVVEFDIVEVSQFADLVRQVDSLQAVIDTLVWQINGEFRRAYGAIGKHSSEYSERLWQTEQRIAELEKPWWPPLPWWESVVIALVAAVVATGVWIGGRPL